MLTTYSFHSVRIKGLEVGGCSILQIIMHLLPSHHPWPPRPSRSPRFAWLDVLGGRVITRHLRDGRHCHCWTTQGSGSDQHRDRTSPTFSHNSAVPSKPANNSFQSSWSTSIILRCIDGFWWGTINLINNSLTVQWLEQYLLGNQYVLKM